MKKEFYIALAATLFLVGCGTETEDDDDSTSLHYQGQSCAACHGGAATAAEGKYFRSGVTVYSDLNSSTFVDGYVVKLFMDDNVSVISYTAGRGVGNSNSGLYNTTLDGYGANKFTAKVVNFQGVVENSSGINTHDVATRLDCNRCHTATGVNGAPGRVTPNIAVVPAPSPALSFSTDIMPLLTASCQSCHGTNGNFTITTASSTYTNINSFNGIDVNTSANSYLLQKATNTFTTAHGGGAIWSTTDASYLTLKAWIDQGALNN